MDTEELFAQPRPRYTPLGLALGEDPAPTIAAAIDAAGGLAWLPSVRGEIVIATADVDARGAGRVATRIVTQIVDERDGMARPLAPDRLPLGALPFIGDRERWVVADVSGRGARIERIPVRRELVEAAALIGVASIGGPADAEPLAIGLWVRHLHPKFAIAARLGGDRAPIVADLALPFFPRLLVLAGQWGSQTVVVATSDLIAAELAGLVLRHGATADPEERIRPWEDPLIQRAAELGLGIEHPSSLDLRPIWAGPIGSPAADALLSLSDLVADALGVL
jgi:hypothetical protein